jgi:sarcosine oxidase
MSEPVSPLDRRRFLQVSGSVGAALAAGASLGLPRPLGATPLIRRGDAGHIVVIGAGVWGCFTAMELLKAGARVTLVDAYGPGNSKSTSGDETRGIRSSYGDRSTGGELWMQWAREAIRRWPLFDAEHGDGPGPELFFTTGDVILRAAPEPFTTRTVEWWTKFGIRHETLSPDELRYRWPQIDATGMTVAIAEPDAGVVRARRATQLAARAVRRLGGTIITARATPGPTVNGRLDGVTLDDGRRLEGDRYVFACGPWLRTLFPSLLENRMRVPLGYVVYFGTPPGDHRFAYPNLPSWNIPGVTGWPVLPIDGRGFRVRGAIAAPAPAAAAANAATPAAAAAPAPPPDPAQQDPDRSSRWATPERIEGSRRVLAARFPALADAPVVETRACHYESTSSRNFMIDTHPDLPNVWITGGGNAEGFKFAPVLGEYIAKRVLGEPGDPAVAAGFKIPETTYDA